MTTAQESVSIAEESGTLIAAIMPDIQKTADLFQSVASASREQTSGAEEISNTIIQLDGIIQNNIVSSGEMSTMAKGLANEAQRLQEAIAFFKSDGDDLEKEEISNKIQMIIDFFQIRDKSGSDYEKTVDFIKKAEKKISSNDKDIKVDDFEAYLSESEEDKPHN